MQKDSKIFIAGHAGLVGSSLVRELKKQGYTRLVVQPKSELNLLRQEPTESFFRSEKIDYVFMAAGLVGGIAPNFSRPADFIYENTMMSANVIRAAKEFGVKKLLYLGSSCVYPRLAPQPIKEAYLLTGELEKTNEAYAIAKISALKMCEAFSRQYGVPFIAAMPSNLYGTGDNFDPETGHAIPALLSRFHQAKLSGAPNVVVWGSGQAKREYLYVDDLAEALVELMLRYEEPELINVGTGMDHSILEIAELIREVTGYKGDILLDKTKPDGTPRKLLDVTRIQKMGWKAKTDLRTGLEKTYRWAIENKALQN